LGRNKFGRNNSDETISDENILHEKIPTRKGWTEKNSRRKCGWNILGTPKKRRLLVVGNAQKNGNDEKDEKLDNAQLVFQEAYFSEPALIVCCD